MTNLDNIFFDDPERLSNKMTNNKLNVIQILDEYLFNKKNKYKYTLYLNKLNLNELIITITSKDFNSFIFNKFINEEFRSINIYYELNNKIIYNHVTTCTSYCWIEESLYKILVTNYENEIIEYFISKFGFPTLLIKRQ